MMLPIILKISDVASKEPFHVRFYKMKQFQHFQYVYNQTAGCQSRLPKLQNNVVSTTQMAKDMFIKIRILGEFKDEDLNLISKKAGRFIMTYYNEKEVLPFVFNFSLSLNLIQFCYRKNQINRRSTHMGSNACCFLSKSSFFQIKIKGVYVSGLLYMYM